MADYEIEVDVVPMAPGFHREAEVLLREEEARTEPVKVGLAPEVKRDFRTKAARSVKEALKELDAAVTVKPELAKSFRRDLQRAVKEATTGEGVAVPITPVLGRTFRADLQRAIKEGVADSAVNVPVHLALASGWRAEFQRTVKEATADRPIAVPVAPELDKRAYAAFVTDLDAHLAAVAEVSRLGVTTELRPGSTEELVAEVDKAAVEASLAAKVHVGVDATKAKAEVLSLGELADKSAEKAKLLAHAALIGFAGVAAGAAGAGIALYKIGSSFDASYDTIRTKTGATGKQLDGLRDQFRAVVGEVPAKFDEAAIAVAGVNQRLTVGAPIAQKLAEQFLELSRITKTDLQTNITGVTGALQSFGVPAEKMPAALDELFRASQHSGVGVDALGASLVASGAALRTAGFSYGQSVALLAQLQKAGVPANQVLGSLSIAARKLAKEGKDPAKSIAELTLQIKNAKNPTDALRLAQGVFGRGAVGVTDAIRSGKFELGGFLATVQGGRDTVLGAAKDTEHAAQTFQGLKNQLALILEQPAREFFSSIAALARQLAPVLRQLGPVIAQLVAGFGLIATGALKAILPLIEQLVPALAPIGRVIGQTFGTLGAALAPLAGAVGRILTAFSPLLPVLGQAAGAVAKALVPALLALADPKFAAAVVQLVQAMADLLVQVAPLIPIMVKLAVPVVTLVTKMLAWKPVLYGLVAGLVAYQLATGAATLATTLFSTASEGLALNPIGLAVAAVVALGVGVYEAYQHFKPFRDVVDAVGRFFRDTFAPAVVGIGKAVGRWLVGAFHDAEDVFKRIWPVLSKVFGIFATLQLGPLIKFGQAIMALFHGDFSGFARKIGEAFMVIPQELGKLGAMILPELAKAGEWVVTQGVPMLAEAAWHLGGALLGWLGDVVPKALAGLGSIILQVGTWLVTSAVPTVAEKAAGLAGAVLGWIVRAAVRAPLLLIQMLAAIIRWIVESGPKIALTIAGWVGAALSWIGGFLVSLPGRWLHAEEAIFGFIIRTGPKIAGKVAGWVGAALSWVGGVLTSLPGKLASITTTVLGWLGGLPGKLIALAPKIVDGAMHIGSAILDGISRGLAAAAKFVGNVAGQIWNGIKGFVNKNVIDPVRSFKVDIGIWSGHPFGSLPRLAAGGLVTGPTLAVVGEAGPELVLPLTNPARMSQLLGHPALTAAASAAGATAGAGAPSPGGGPGGAAGVKAWVAAATMEAAKLPAAIEAATIPGLTKWEADAQAQFVALLGMVQTTADLERQRLTTWATVEVPQATVPKIVVWRMLMAQQLALFINETTVSFTKAATMAATAWQAGLTTMVRASSVSGDAIVKQLVGKLQAASASVLTVTTSYRNDLAGALNPILAAVGAQQLKFARGGHVPGPDVREDVVPALLMPGEVVIRRDSVAKFGVANLLALNEGQVPAGWYAPTRMATGGVIAPDAIARGKAYGAAQVGKPYVWGATGPNGFDCSGLAGAIVNVIRGDPPNRRLFTSQSLSSGWQGLGFLPGYGQVTIGDLASSHVAMTLDGVNFEATPPAVRMGPRARGADAAMFNQRFHLGTGLFTPGGAASLAWPAVPRVPPGTLGQVAAAAMGFVGNKGKDWGLQHVFNSALAVAPGAFAGDPGAPMPVNVAHILATIRAMESGGNYTARNPVSTASGAYQFLDSTWHGYGGFPRAYLAPPPVQDARAAQDVQRFLGMYGGALESVPAAWYTGSYRGHGHLNYNPGGAGNPLTVQGYVDRWLAKYASIPGFAKGGLVGPMPKGRGRPMVTKATSSNVIDLTRGWGGPGWPGPGAGGMTTAGPRLNIDGDVNLNVTPPGSHDPESYAAALGHRAVPVLAAVADRTS